MSFRDARREILESPLAERRSFAVELARTLALDVDEPVPPAAIAAPPDPALGGPARTGHAARDVARTIADFHDLLDQLLEEDPAAVPAALELLAALLRRMGWRPRTSATLVDLVRAPAIADSSELRAVIDAVFQLLDARAALVARAPSMFARAERLIVHLLFADGVPRGDA